MAKASASPGWQRALVILTSVVVGTIVVVCLYWAQTIFIPVALAVFLTFLLSPLVSRLERARLGRVPSVILVVVLAAGVFAGGGWAVAHQVLGLVDGLPTYTSNIKTKVQDLREMTHGSGRLGQMFEDIIGAWNLKPAGEKDQPGPAGVVPRPPAVVLQPETLDWSARLPAVLGSTAESLGGLALALVLVLFMLFKREDLRNRLMRLVGYGRLTVMTKAVDEAGDRIGRFLRMQLLLNFAFGLMLTLGLLLIGVDYAFLWGFLAAILRYVPYLGIWVAAVLPVLLSVAMFESWVPPFLVVGVFLVLELIISSVLEPLLFGKSMGVSAVAMLISAAFWAFLWGPIGMVLSSPLTVCLAVLGRYVPHLAFLDVLLGDEPALDPQVSYYQRLLARDQDEATAIVLARAKAVPVEQIYDDVLVPALSYAKQDRMRDELSDADEQFMLQATREILEDLGERQTTANAALTTANGDAAAERPKVRLVGCPGHDEADRLALEMLRQLLDPTRWDVDILSTTLLSAELVVQAGQRSPQVVCVGALPPGGLAHARYLCKRLRAQLPQARILIGRWGLRGNVEQNEEQLREAGADQVATALLATRDHLDTWLPVLVPAAVKVGV